MNSFTTLRFCVLLIVIEIVVAMIAIRRAPNRNAFLIGDCPYYAATTISLLHDGDWDLSNQEAFCNGFFALSKDNRLVPKHSVLMPLLSIPFYLVFGTFGFLIFNLLQLFALFVGLTLLAGNGPAARLLALVSYLSTPFLAYTFNYSPDVLGAALLVWSYVCAICRRPLLAGLLAGLAVWAKVYLAILLLPMALIVLPQGWRATLTAAVAAFAAMLPMLAIQAHLFGSPFVFGYDRDAYLSENGLVVIDHYSRFNQPFVAGLGHLLFDQRIGLLRTAPLWFLWPIGVIVAWRNVPDVRRKTIALTLSLILNLLFFATYDEWDASESGNRFLFPALAIGFALQGPLWRRMIEGRVPKQAQG